MNHRNALAAALLVLCSLALASCVTGGSSSLASDAPALDTKNWRLATRWRSSAERAVYSSRTFTKPRGPGDEEYVFQTTEEVIDARAKNFVVNPFRENRIHVAKLVTIKTSAAGHSVLQTFVLLNSTDFTPLRLDVTNADLAGDAFKQFINQHDRLDWHQFSCMPDEGQKSGSSPSDKSLVFENALLLMLRAYPFEGDHRPMKVLLLPDQTAAAFTSAEPVPATIAYEGVVYISVADALPNLYNEPVQTHHLAVTPVGGKADDTLHFWFAANPKFDHVLIQYNGHGDRLYLRQLDTIEQ